MTTRFILTLAFGLIANFATRSAAQDELKPGELTPYPWVEESDTVRVPKALLPHLEFHALDRFTNTQIPWSYLSRSFIQLYRVTENEAGKVNAAIRKCERETRFEEGSHLRALSNRASLGGYRSPEGLAVLEQRQFELEPLGETRQSITQRRDGEIVRILGKERSDALQDHIWSPLPRGSKVIESTMTITFRRIDIGGFQSVDRVIVYPDGGNFGGGPFFEEEDEFVVDHFRPVLKQWRTAILEFNRPNQSSNSKISQLPLRAPGLPTIAAQDPPHSVEQATRWDDAATFVDIPKASLHEVGLPMLRRNELSTEAMVVFGLSVQESNVVTDLFRKAKAQFESVERSQVFLIQGEDRHFVLHPFPQMAGEIRKEWLSRLKILVGNRRGELINECLRDQQVSFALWFMRPPDQRGEFPLPIWPTWLKRGTREIQFIVGSAPPDAAKGPLKFQGIAEDGTISNADRGDIGEVPDSMRHLFDAWIGKPRRKEAVDL